MPEMTVKMRNVSHSLLSALPAGTGTHSVSNLLLHVVLQCPARLRTSGDRRDDRKLSARERQTPEEPATARPVARFDEYLRHDLAALRRPGSRRRGAPGPRRPCHHPPCLRHVIRAAETVAADIFAWGGASFPVPWRLGPDAVNRVFVSASSQVLRRRTIPALLHPAPEPGTAEES